MNYRHIYCVIISHAKSEEKLGLRKKGNGEYYEAHHILPKSLFPLWKEKNSNIVLLTAREHFFCHQLLTKIYPSKEMNYALIAFKVRPNTDIKNYKISSKEYERLRKLHSEMMKNMFKNFPKEKQLEINEKRKISRSNRTEEQKLKTKEKVKAAWAKRTEEEKIKSLEKRRKKLKNRTEEENREIQRKRLATLNNRPEEEKLKTKIKQKSWYSNFSKKEKEDYHKKVSEGVLKSIDKIQENRRKTMENWSDEQKENYIKSHSYGALNSEKMKTAQLKYKKYKENGGKLKWNYWRHLGMPIEDNSSKAIEDKSENKSE